MKITTVTYKRIKNLGNYQSETLEMTAEIQPGEDFSEITDQLIKAVLNKLYFPESQF
jgi:hypothetical protein